MKKELVYVSENIKGEELQSFVLKYFLIEEHVDVPGGFGFYSYGIEILKEGASGSESRAAMSISPDRQEVLDFILRMAKGAVTPSAFYDVICDELFKKSLDMCKTLCS
ncbi:MAG: hypothetical protein E7410_06715 [Ruminococcaceae bacterium]|nr:hypothetical protein [Oscillospiraceae bacterium]